MKAKPLVYLLIIFCNIFFECKKSESTINPANIIGTKWSRLLRKTGGFDYFEKIEFIDGANVKFYTWSTNPVIPQNPYYREYQLIYPKLTMTSFDSTFNKEIISNCIFNDNILTLIEDVIDGKSYPTNLTYNKD